MSVEIYCLGSQCTRNATYAKNLLDLVCNHTDDQGWIVCKCGKHGYVAKNFDYSKAITKEHNPSIRAAILCNGEYGNYHPCVFLVSQTPQSPICQMWFYGIDENRMTGKLNLGPPPQFQAYNILPIISSLLDKGVLTVGEVKALIKKKRSLKLNKPKSE